MAAADEAAVVAGAVAVAGAAADSAAATVRALERRVEAGHELLRDRGARAANWGGIRTLADGAPANHPKISKILWLFHAYVLCLLSLDRAKVFFKMPHSGLISRIIPFRTPLVRCF